MTKTEKAAEFNLEKEARDYGNKSIAKTWQSMVKGEVSLQPPEHHYKAGFNKALDLVMEKAKEASESTQPDDEEYPVVMIADLKAIISKLKGQR